MPKIVTFLFAWALISQANAQSPGQTVASLLKQAQAAEQAGDPVAANEHYKNALKLDPQNPNIRYSMGQLKINSAAIAAKGRAEKVGAVNIPLYQLDQATLQEALQTLQSLMEKESKETVAPNFVVDDGKGVLADRKISLNLKNMPAKGIIKYLTAQTGTKVRYDEHAVVFTPR